MQIYSVFVGFCVLCGLWNIVITLLIYNALQKRGLPVNFFLLRLLAPKYAFQYKEITRAESGRVGPLFYNWIVSINLALVFAIIGAILSI